MRYRFVAGLALGLAFAAGVAYSAANVAYFTTPPTATGQAVCSAGTDGILQATGCPGGAGTGTANTWTAPQTFSTRVASTPVVLSGATPTPDASATNVFTLTLSAATTMNNPTNLVAGDTITFVITQAATAYNITWGTAYKFTGTAPTISTGSGKVDIFTCTSPTGTNCYMAGVSQNF